MVSKTHIMKLLKNKIIIKNKDLYNDFTNGYSGSREIVLNQVIEEEHNK